MEYNQLICIAVTHLVKFVRSPNRNNIVVLHHEYYRTYNDGRERRCGDVSTGKKLIFKNIHSEFESRKFVLNVFHALS